MRYTSHLIVAVAAGVLLACGDARPSPAAFSAADRRAIERLHDEFADGWVSGDSARVLQTLTADAVILPHWGDDPVVGVQAIQAFWWPSGAPPTRVLHFTMRADEIAGTHDLAFARGRYALTFEVPSMEGPRSVTTAGNYLMLFRRELAGWRISHRIWNDPPPR